MTLASLVSDARTRLIASLALEPTVAALEASVLLSYVLKQSRTYLLTHPQTAIDAADIGQFTTVLQRRLRGEPIAYLLGRREFYSMEFEVTPAVLIPRPETELLVTLALSRISETHSSRILDLGTGSGAIALSIAKLRPLAQVTAVDCAPAALAVAQRNAIQLNCKNITLFQSDWFAALDAGAPFDLILSNPPYIAAADSHLNQGDVQWEPRSALVSGVDGLDAIRAIALQARHYLTQDGCLMFEHGYDQGEASKQILQSCGWRHILSHKDLEGRTRVTGGIL